MDGGRAYTLNMKDETDPQYKLYENRRDLQDNKDNYSATKLKPRKKKGIIVYPLPDLFSPFPDKIIKTKINFYKNSCENHIQSIKKGLSYINIYNFTWFVVELYYIAGKKKDDFDDDDLEDDFYDDYYDDYDDYDDYYDDQYNKDRNKNSLYFSKILFKFYLVFT